MGHSECPYKRPDRIDCSNFLTFFVKEVIMDTVKDVTVYPTPFVKPHCVLIVLTPLFYS